MTPFQRRTLGWLNRRWWVSDRLYFRLADRWSDRAVARTRQDQADWRVQLPGQETWIRATKLQYSQAAALGLPCNVGVPALP